MSYFLKNNLIIKMGNCIVTNTRTITLEINITKYDISQDYDLTTDEGVKNANEELIQAFSESSDDDRNVVMHTLFIKIQ
jgi:hypothetical protein